MEELNEVGDRKLSNLKEMVETNKGQISARAGTLDSGNQSPPSSNYNTDKNEQKQAGAELFQAQKCLVWYEIRFE